MMEILIAIFVGASAFAMTVLGIFLIKAIKTLND